MEIPEGETTYKQRDLLNRLKVGVHAQITKMGMLMVDLPPRMDAYNVVIVDAARIAELEAEIEKLRDAGGKRVEPWIVDGVHDAFEQFRNALDEIAKEAEVSTPVQLDDLDSTVARIKPMLDSPAEVPSVLDRTIRILTNYDRFQDDAWKKGYWNGVREVALPLLFLLALCGLLFQSGLS